MHSNGRKTPLFDLIVAQKARLTEFAGWVMPIQFAGLRQEHEAVRTRVGAFDISHMAKFQLQGTQILAALETLVPTDLSGLQSGQAQYTVLLNPEGGVIDDIIIYAQGEQAAVIIANAATHDGDWAWLQEQLTPQGIRLTDVSDDRVLIALQGPQAATTLQALLPADVDLSKLSAFSHLTTQLGGETIFLARTGYTGEDGFEIMAPPEAGRQLWRSLMEVGVTPCGLGARDTLRLEAAMALYGQDLDDQTTPLEAGLRWLVHLERKGDFIGRAALERQKAEGLPRRLVGLEMQGRHIARHDYLVQVNGETVGMVTSGTLSPTLGKAIALAYVPSAQGKVGKTVDVVIRGKTYLAKVVKKPFYRSPNRPQK
ncbi:MAG: glycine cleavage system aminomethyltransferase GcvT [Spirulina sp. SIO3F2]|nr:glycine cleavage system aminomethyltransferase GcvT [Spirulina sp. SIO3F2]